MTTRIGELKIFLGAMAGVGETGAMLDAARRSSSAGLRIAVGYFRASAGDDRPVIPEALEQVPPMIIRSGAVVAEEMDLEGILRRAPDIVLIEDLGHLNTPGAKHACRYMDVKEILSAGIGVYGTLDIKDVRSLSEAVYRITGNRTKYTIPDSFFRGAEIILVDAPADVMIRREQRENIQPPGSPGGVDRQLAYGETAHELRELAMRFAVERISAEPGVEKPSPGNSGARKPVERVLACIGPSPFGNRVLASARRLCDTLECEMLALSVEVPGKRVKSVEHDYLERNVKLADELGAEVLRESGNDVAAVILKTVDDKEVTHLVMGKSFRHRYRDMMRPSIVERVISRSKGTDIHLVPGAREELPPRIPRARQPLSGRQALRYLWIAVMVGMVTLICKAAGDILDLADIALLFLLPVLYAGAFVGVASSVATAVVSVLAFDMLFVPPYYHLTVEDIHYLISFAVFLLVAISTGLLASRLRGQIIESTNAEARARTLYGLSKELAAVSTIEEFGGVLVGQVKRMFGVETALYLPSDDSTVEVASSSTLGDRVSVMKQEAGVAGYAYVNGRTAGAGTGVFPQSRGAYYPLKSEQGVIGVMGFFSQRNPSENSLKRQETFQAVASLATLALNKLYLALATQHVQTLEASERLWNALFDSVSHDLRTPLSSITGAVTTLMDRRMELTQEQRESLLGNIEKGSAQMNRLIGKLLDMARVESGSLRTNMEWCDIQDIVGVALSGLSGTLDERRLVVDIQQDLPLIKVDFALITQVEINLIDNAIKYAPESSSIEVVWELLEEGVVSSVGDRGPGVNPEDRERVFDKFSRLNTDSGVRGTGLGLSICRAIVVAHGGHIWVEDRPGGGSVFKFCLPVDTLYPDMMEEIERG